MSKNAADQGLEAAASQRVDELADEVQGRYAQRGREVSFGFDTAMAAFHLIRAFQHIEGAKEKAPDPASTAFLLPAQDAALMYKSSSYALKHVLGIHIASKVRELIDRDGRSAEFENLYRRAVNAYDAQVRADALDDLLCMVKPYSKRALDVLRGDVENYDPFNELGIAGHRIWER